MGDENVFVYLANNCDKLPSSATYVCKYDLTLGSTSIQQEFDYI